MADLVVKLAPLELVGVLHELCGQSIGNLSVIVIVVTLVVV